MKNCPGCSREIDRHSIACQYCGRVAEVRQQHKNSDLRAAKSRTLTIAIDCEPKKVYQFVCNLANLPTWAKTFAKSAKKSKGVWVIETPQGPVRIRMAKKNNLGVLDHYVTPSEGQEVFVPMRVVPRTQGSEVIFTLFAAAGMTEENFKKDVGFVEQDLKSLKQVMERQ